MPHWPASGPPGNGAATLGGTTMMDSDDVGRSGRDAVNKASRDVTDQAREAGGTGRESVTRMRDDTVNRVRSTDAPQPTHHSMAQTSAGVIGLISTVLGILGFIPGVTRNLGDLRFAGNGSGSMLFGTFQTSWLMNLVTLAIGIVGILAARHHVSARNYLYAAGILFLAFWVYGLATRNTSGANFMPFNTNRDWLHFGLGIASLALAAVTSRQHVNVPMGRTPHAYGH
jgi:hypothetical protein